MTDFEKARHLLHQFKGNSYLYGKGVLPKLGDIAADLGRKAVLIRGTFPGSDNAVEIIHNSLSKSKVELTSQLKGSRPNSPREDLYRITDEINQADPDLIISFGGGSTIDATKAANVLHTLERNRENIFREKWKTGTQIDDYFGTDLVTKILDEAGCSLMPHIAIQSVAGSAAHLTKYANITDVSIGQKKLIVDDAIVPTCPVFDYEITYSTPANLTIDGAMDGIAHCLEVLFGSVGKPFYNQIEQIADICITLVLKYLPIAINDPESREAREALCLATDLGGYAIMTGGTNGGHLNSFSLVDILPHGRACAIMNPYYTVFFAPAIERPLRLVGEIYKQAGLIRADLDNLKGRQLGIAVAEAMFEFATRIGLPIRLGEIEGFSNEHIDRAIAAAKNQQLKMKLKNMPVSLTADMVDDYMRPVLEAAASGDISIIKNVSV